MIRRFVLLWLTGFVGTWVMTLSGKPLLLFALFAASKLVLETGALLARSKTTRVAA